MMKVTFWLYWGSKVLDAVRAPEGSTDAEVRAIALDWHRRVPLSAGTGYAPFEWANMLGRAEVKRFE